MHYGPPAEIDAQSNVGQVSAIRLWMRESARSAHGGCPLRPGVSPESAQRCSGKGTTELLPSLAACRFGQPATTPSSLWPRLTLSRERWVANEFFRLKSHSLFQDHLRTMRQPNQKRHVTHFLDVGRVSRALHTLRLLIACFPEEEKSNLYCSRLRSDCRSQFDTAAVK
jgi:hypothetical protein